LVKKDLKMIAGDTEEDKKIWFTYHSNALKATRKAIEVDNLLKNVRASKSDNALVCIKNSKAEDFSLSLIAIVLNVFAIEYRINRVAEMYGIWTKKVTSYIDKKGNKKVLKKSKKFNEFGLYLKLRNIINIAGLKEKKYYLNRVNKLDKWISIRNKIAHGDHKEIQALNITPKKARQCFNDITKAIFDLNVVMGYNKRKNADETCTKMLL